MKYALAKQAFYVVKSWPIGWLLLFWMIIKMYRFRLDKVNSAKNDKINSGNIDALQYEELLNKKILLFVLKFYFVMWVLIYSVLLFLNLLFGYECAINTVNVTDIDRFWIP